MAAVWRAAVGCVAAAAATGAPSAARVGARTLPQPLGSLQRALALPAAGPPAWTLRWKGTKRKSPSSAKGKGKAGGDGAKPPTASPGARPTGSSAAAGASTGSPAAATSVAGGGGSAGNTAAPAAKPPPPGSSASRAPPAPPARAAGTSGKPRTGSSDFFTQLRDRPGGCGAPIPTDPTPFPASQPCRILQSAASKATPASSTSAGERIGSYRIRETCCCCSGPFAPPCALTATSPPPNPPQCEAGPRRACPRQWPPSACARCRRWWLPLPPLKRATLLRSTARLRPARARSSPPPATSPRQTCPTRARPQTLLLPLRLLPPPPHPRTCPPPNHPLKAAAPPRPPPPPPLPLRPRRQTLT